MGSRQAVIVGAGDHAVSVAETVRSAGYELVGFTSKDDFGSTLFNLPVTREIPMDHLASGGMVILAIGDNATRESAWMRLAATVPVEQLPAVFHASAIIAPAAQISAGAVIMQGAIVANQARVGFGCLLNTGSILEHECELSGFASLAPRAVTGGRVRIGARTAISIGAVLKHGLTIGEDTVVGGSSYVDRDLPSGVVAYGVPARVIRSRERGDAYLG
ncbi:MAG: transferase [Actinomycetota bacterium]|nr:transferase [Actinomycetota bacterium]